MEKIKRFFKNEFVKLILIGVVINALCFVFGTCYAKASGQVEYTSLPYKVQNRLNYDISVYAQAYNSFWGNPNIIGSSIYVVDWNNPNILAWSIVDGQEVWNHFMLPMNSNPNGEYYSVDLNGYPYATFDTTQNHLSIQFDAGYWYHTIIVERSDGRIDAYGFDNTSNGMRISFFSTFSQPTFLNGGVYYWNLQEKDAPVLYTNTSDLIEPGEPVQPEWDDDLPNKPTKPTTPTPPTKPTINDVSDLADYLKDLFQWLINVIGLWFNYLSDLLEWLITKLSNTIKQGFENIFNNFKNFFKPYLENFQTLLENIKNFISDVKDILQNFFKPFDFNQSQTQLNNSSAITSIRGIVANIKTFANVFSNTSEPDNLIFTLDFRNNSFFNFGLCYLDFNVIKPFRSAIRLIIGCLLVFGLIVTISTSINAYIGGNSSKNEG